MAPTSMSMSLKEDLDDGMKTSKKAPGTNFAPLVVAMVGLPARGKTVLSHKLNRYLNWNGLNSKVFSISFYRRKHVELYNSHEIFRTDNKEGYEIIQQSAKEAMEDALDFLKSEGNIAILDGTHATPEMRQKTLDYFSKQFNFKVLFIECICDDVSLLEKNIKEILQFSKDYRNMTKEKALDDFHHKIEDFMEKYETIDPREESKYSYIKVFNAGENVSIHRLNGPYQTSILSFVSSFKPGPRTLYFSRHGESEFNVVGRIGGDTDLSPRGRKYASALASFINEAAIPDLHVWTSEKRRTKQTAAGIAATSEPIAALNELDAGVCEGLSYEEMQVKFPQEFAWRDQDKLHYRYPWGESYLDIMARLEPVLLELEHSNNLLTISHQAVLRCILGYFLNSSLDELPYLNVPLHTVIKLTTEGYKSKIEFIKLNVECVDTYRKQPVNCNAGRTTEDALLTVPAHFDNLWPILPQNLMGQH